MPKACPYIQAILTQPHPGSFYYGNGVKQPGVVSEIYLPTLRPYPFRARRARRGCPRFRYIQGRGIPRPTPPKKNSATHPCLFLFISVIKKTRRQPLNAVKHPSAVKHLLRGKTRQNKPGLGGTGAGRGRGCLIYN